LKSWLQPEDPGETMRTLKQIIPSIPTSDGAGVKLRRSLGSRHGAHVDPFLMLDEFYSDNPDDYLAGFPSHPHRGFETVTYMLDGHMRHEDHLGNRGDLKPGDVQWMTAARGIIHSEMPQQTAGRMRGFQLWINLPAKEKMNPAHYRDIPAKEIPVLELASGAHAKVIAGSVDLGSGPVSGPVNSAAAPLSTDPLYLDIHLPAQREVTVPIARGHHGFIYLYEGDARVGPENGTRDLPARSGGVLSDEGAVRIQSGNTQARLLLLAAKPIGEPVVQYGPFVMNTRQEIEQAVEDFRSGRFAA
jgi:redox-sensitive bicupin YhaK (pirin superfamily)